MLQRIWLLTIEALDAANTPVTLRFSSGDYTDPTGNYYDLRIKQPALYTSGAYTNSVIQSPSRSAFGETTLVNTDGGLDYLADYAVDGREAVLSLRDETGAVVPIIEGTIRSISFQERILSVQLRDPQEVLQQLHPENTFAGNNVLPNGLEGTTNDIKGQVKPKVYGKVRNATPVLVNTSKLIYEVHDLDVSPTVDIEVTDVYDRGALLTHHVHETNLTDFLNNTVPSSKYSTYEGYIKLGSTPTGTVTCDVDSTKFLFGDVFELLAIEAGFTLNSTDKTTLNSLGTADIYLTQSTTTSSLFDLLASSIGGYWYFSTPTEIRVRQLIVPSSPTVDILDYQIVSIARNSTGAGSNGLPVYRVKMKADKVQTVQNDLAGVVSDTFKARVATQYREAVYESGTVKTRHPLSEEMEIVSAFRDLSSAQTQADRIGTLLGVRRDSVQITVRLDEDIAGQIMIGTVINLKSYKFGYSAGKNFIVLGFTIDARLSRLTLELFG